MRDGINMACGPLFWPPSQGVVAVWVRHAVPVLYVRTGAMRAVVHPRRCMWAPGPLQGQDPVPVNVQTLDTCFCGPHFLRPTGVLCPASGSPGGSSSGCCRCCTTCSQWYNVYQCGGSNGWLPLLTTALPTYCTVSFHTIHFVQPHGSTLPDRG